MTDKVTKKTKDDIVELKDEQLDVVQGGAKITGEGGKGKEFFIDVTGAKGRAAPNDPKAENFSQGLEDLWPARKDGSKE